MKKNGNNVLRQTKSTIFAHGMKKCHRHILKKWFLLILFVSYTSGISLFTHTHVINHSVYVHSHPFKAGEGKQHSHTQNQLFLLDHFYHTQITSDILPDLDMSDQTTPSRVAYTTLYESLRSFGNRGVVSLRAPPAA